jgi:hypothetical protein
MMRKASTICRSPGTPYRHCVITHAKLCLRHRSITCWPLSKGTGVSRHPVAALSYRRTQASAGHQQALRFPRRPVCIVPRAEAEIDAGVVLPIIDDEAIALAVWAFWIDQIVRPCG